MKRIVIWGGWLAVGLALAMLGSYLFARSREAQLPDGTRIRVLAVTQGRNHPFSTSPWWLDWMRDHAPKFARGLLGKTAFQRTVTTDHNCLVAWLSRYHPASDQYRNWENNRWQWQVFDEHGCPIGNNCEWARPGATNERPVAWITIPAYPRLQNAFILKGQCDGKDFSLRIHNPFPARSAEWKADTLPVMRRVGDVEVSLTAIRRMGAPKDAWVNYTPVFEFRRGGVMLSNWFTTESTFVDAVGNRAQRLCALDPVWKVDTTLYPSAFADFADPDILAVGKLQIPAPGYAVTLPVNAALNTQGVFFVGWSGRGDFTVSNGVWIAAKSVERRPNASPYGGYSNRSGKESGGWWSRQCTPFYPSLWLATTNRSWLGTVIARARGEDGRIYPDLWTGREVSQENDIYFRQCFFDIADTNSEVKLELLPVRMNRLSFLVKPPQ